LRFAAPRCACSLPPGRADARARAAAQEEAKDAFKELLAAVKCGSEWTWEQAMRVIISDPRCSFGPPHARPALGACACELTSEQAPRVVVSGPRWPQACACAAACRAAP